MKTDHKNPTVGLWIFRAAAVATAGVVVVLLCLPLLTRGGGPSANPSALLALPLALFAGLKLMAFGLSMHRSQRNAEHLDAMAIKDGTTRYPGWLGNALLLTFGLVMIFGAKFLSAYLYR